MSVIVKSFEGNLWCKPITDLGRNGHDLKHNISEIGGLPSDEITLTCNGRLVKNDDELQANHVYYVSLSLKGGKGGFGSMLRMLGAQIEKTTNHEACRDLSGRRMRDVNNEKKLAEWVKNKANAEAEREQRRREKLERMARDPKHFFVDPNYEQQKQDVAESLEEAVTKGMEASASSGPSTSGATSVVKRKGPVTNNSNTKKRCMWMGVEDDSDDDSDNEGDDQPQYPASCSQSKVTQQPENSSTSSSSSSTTSPSEERTDEDSQQTEQKDETEIEDKSIVEQNRSDDAAKEEDQQTTTVEESGPVNLDDYSSVSELEALGLERLKSALMDRGLKCGGTLQQRAERLFAIKGLTPEQIDPSLKAKPAKGKKKGKK